MRKLLILAVLLVILVSCARQSVYLKDGVYYVNNPERELNAIGKFNPQPPLESELGLYVNGYPVQSEDNIYYPVITSFVQEGNRISSTVVYAYDLQSDSVTDSLVLAEENIKRDYKHLVMTDNILVIGVKDSALHIVKADKDLQIISEHSFGIRTNFVAYAAMFRDFLRLVISDINHNLVMYEIDTATMQTHRSRLLAGKYYRYYQDRGDLWFFNETEKDITVLKLDLTALDPNPLIKTFDFAIKDSYDMQSYSAVAFGKTFYIGHTVAGEKGMVNYRLTSFDFETGNKVSRDFSGYLSFDVLSNAGQTYIFRTAQQKKRDVFTIAELTPDLQETEPLLQFYLTDMHSVRRILALGEKQVFLLGNYMVTPPAKSKKAELPAKPDGLMLKPFMAVYTLD